MNQQPGTARADLKSHELGHDIDWINTRWQDEGNCRKCGRPAIVRGHDAIGSALLVTCQQVRK